MRVSLYILLALAVLVVAAITRMPASIAVNQILQRVNLPADITIRYTKGTIWEGQTQLTFRTFPSLTLRWDIDAFHSFSALQVEIEAVSPASRLSGLVQLIPKRSRSAIYPSLLRLAISINWLKPTDID